MISKPDDVVAPKLNPALSKHITEIARSFNDTVDKFFKYQTRIEKLSNDMDYMTKEPEKNAYPTGTRPFRTPATDVELDAPVINAMERPITFSVTVKQGATRREAMVHLHHKMTLEIKRIQYEAALAHLEKLKPMITRKAYWESINSWKTEELDELGLQRGIRQLPNRDLAINRAEEAYTQIVDRILARKAREKADKEAKELEKKRMDDEMLKNGPADALRELISVGVKAEFKRKNTLSRAVRPLTMSELQQKKQSRSLRRRGRSRGVQPRLPRPAAPQPPRLQKTRNPGVRPGVQFWRTPHHPCHDRERKRPEIPERVGQRIGGA